MITTLKQKPYNYGIKKGKPPLTHDSVSECILEATENPVTFSGNQIIVKSGLKYLTSVGRNPDRTLKSNEYTTEQDYTITVADSGVLFISPNNDLGNEGILHRAAYYYEQSTPPSIDFTPVMLWRNPAENKNYYAWKNGGINEWTEIECTVLNRYIFAEGAVQSLAPLNPIQVANAQDLDGIWTRKNKYIVESLNVSGRKEYTYNLSDYLPNDGNVYEVMFSVIMDTGTTAGNIIEGTIRDSVLSITGMLGRCVTRTTSTNILNRSIIIPMASRNIITMFNGNGQIGWLQAVGYRKVR